jgi:hypothetical protein
MDTAIAYAMNEAAAYSHSRPAGPPLGCATGRRDGVRHRAVAKHHIASAMNGPPIMVTAIRSGSFV